MPSIWLVPPIVAFITVFAGVIGLPALVTFVIRRNKPTGCLLLLGTGLIGAAAGLLVASLISLPIEAALALPHVQEAIDAQCGLGFAQADIGGYSNDPYISWTGGDEAGCQFLNQQESWDCYCAADAPAE